MADVAPELEVAGLDDLEIAGPTGSAYAETDADVPGTVQLDTGERGDRLHRQQRRCWRAGSLGWRLGRRVCSRQRATGNAGDTAAVAIRRYTARRRNATRVWGKCGGRIKSRGSGFSHKTHSFNELHVEATPIGALLPVVATEHRLPKGNRRRGETKRRDQGTPEGL